MAKASWKSSVLVAAILVVALALQAGAIRIMINLARPSGPPPGKVENRALPVEPAAPLAAAVEPARQPATDSLSPSAGAPAPPVLETRPESALSSSEPPSPPAAPKPAETVIGQPAPGGNPPTTAEAPPAISDTASPAAPPAELQDPAWLKTRDPQRYTVQLYRGKNLNKLKDIAGTAAPAEPRAYFVTGSRSSPWYALVVGDYPDAAAARAAAKNLAPSATTKPWVRRFDEIQANMRQGIEP